MLELKDIVVSFGIHEVLKGISLKIVPGDRIALIGANGAGKSTLLKVAAGQVDVLAGSAARQKGIRIGYLPQAGLVHRGKGLWEEVIEALPEWNLMLTEQQGILETMQTLTEGDPEHARVLARYGDLETRFGDLGGYSMESRILAVLSGLGFQDTDRDRLTETYSGGWQMRIALAKVLLVEPHILLLDEPTDHLDLDARTWLIEYLKTYPGALFVVSHDRYFLDVLAAKVAELLNGKLELYHGNYSQFIEQKKKGEKALYEAYLRQQEAIQRIKTFIAKNRSRKDRARQVQTRIRRLEEMQLLNPPSRSRQMRLQFPAPARSARRQVELFGIEKSYGDRDVLAGLDLVLERGDRIAVIGANGVGKSTLLRIIAGTEPFQRGFRQVGPNVSIGYFSQVQLSVRDSSATVIEDITESAPELSVERLRTLLGCFLFRGEEVSKRLSVLSGGERTRLALARLIIKGHNVLLLDEPTNHLDLASKDVLLEALLGFTGTVVFVSHDRYFINSLATRILKIGYGAVESYLGNYEDYLTAVQKETEAEQRGRVTGGQQGKLNDQTDASSGKQDRILARERQKEQVRQDRRRARRIGALEIEINEVERRIRMLSSEMARPELCTNYVRLSELQSEKESLEERLDLCLKEWERLQEEQAHVSGETVS